MALQGKAGPGTPSRARWVLAVVLWVLAAVATWWIPGFAWAVSVDSGESAFLQGAAVLAIPWSAFVAAAVTATLWAGNRPLHAMAIMAVTLVLATGILATVSALGAQRGSDTQPQACTQEQVDLLNSLGFVVGTSIGSDDDGSCSAVSGVSVEEGVESVVSTMTASGWSVVQRESDGTTESLTFEGDAPYVVRIAIVPMDEESLELRISLHG